MHIDDFLERGASVKGLCEGFLAGAPTHAALLLGPSGVGKRTLASTLAQSLYCTGSAPKPCGTCPGCRRYLAGSHPDAYRIEAQKRIGVDAIRELIASLSAAAYEGGWRSVIIESAGAMTTQAQNSLLKTLEEPPAQTVFLLTVISASQLLPTIRSRCRIVQVPPFPEAELERLLRVRGLEAGRARQLAAMSGGSLGDALQMDADQAFWALRDRVLRAMESVRQPGDVLGAMNALKDDKSEATRACDLLENAFREAMMAKLQVSAMDIEGAGWPGLSQASVKSLTTLLGKVQTLRQMLASNVSWQAALERFLLEYAEERKAWQL